MKTLNFLPANTFPPRNLCGLDIPINAKNMSSEKIWMMSLGLHLLMTLQDLKVRYVKESWLVKILTASTLNPSIMWQMRDVFWRRCPMISLSVNNPATSCYQVSIVNIYYGQQNSLPYHRWSLSSMLREWECLRLPTILPQIISYNYTTKNGIIKNLFIKFTKCAFLLPTNQTPSVR